MIRTERTAWLVTPSVASAGSRAAPFLPAALLGLLLATAFAGPLSGRVFYLRDVAQNHHPVRHLVTERLAALDLPLWDPYHGGGTPLLANPNHLVLHPITLLFFALPFDAAFSASIVLQFLLLAAGMFLLARALGASPPAATVAAAMAALSGPAASLSSMQNVVSSFAWVPLGLWALRRGCERRSGIHLAGAAGCFAVVLVAAEPASILSFLLIAPIVAAAENRETPGHRAWRLPKAAFLAIVVALGALIAAAQVLPARDLIGLSERAAGFSASEGLKWSLRPARLLETALPRLFGDPTRLAPDAWWGRFMFEGGYPFLLSLHLGGIACLMAAAGAWPGGSGARRRRALGAVATLGVILALGANGVVYRALFETLAPLRQVRYPERFLLVALVPLALFAAAGCDRLFAPRAAGAGAPRRIAALVAASVATFVALTVVVAAPAWVDAALSSVASIPGAVLASETGAVIRGGVLRSGLWLFMEIVVLLACVAAAARRAALGAPAAWVAVAIAGGSMAAAAAPARSTADPRWLSDPSPLRESLPRGPGAARLHHEPRPDRLSVWARTDEQVWGYRFDRFTYSLASGHRDRIPTVLEAATDRMDLRDGADLGRALRAQPLDVRLKILAVAHAGHLLAWQPIEHPDLEAGPVLDTLSRPPLRVYRLRRTLPRARFRAEAVISAHPSDPAAGLADPRYDPWRAVLLDDPPPPPAGAAVAGGGGSETMPEVQITHDEAERVRLTVDAPRAGYVVLADAFAPGWRAVVDGVPAPILKADGLFRAVPVGPGRHEVTMTYVPSGLRLGALLSLLGAAGALALAVVGRRGR